MLSYFRRDMIVILLLNVVLFQFVKAARGLKRPDPGSSVSLFVVFANKRGYVCLSLDLIIKEGFKVF